MKSLAIPIRLTIQLFALLLCGIFAFLHLSDWYVVKIKQQTAEYPFGSEGPTPYYYRSAELYSNVSLVWGILFLITFAFVLWLVLSKREKGIQLTVGPILLIVMGQLIHAQMGV
ncbi:hypothetical protein [Phaeocystidibacter marisrubri]|uniref:Uncharacterized protein n=1 Tax=Phaeocystidibacter marisrubri TaxID=1577780 RepID=A0A6L3ZD36_9FLAO|nr:hypothetical protein [Phaeocystidibacter marisrubri]KAB2815143.1 hypothetical protein F8C82_13675 [Phaeocystidibacter marisrubri]GGH70555.1 hypothetical protein GCM10011318_12670 [Phaeocystidibacter marisrubri]